MDDYKSITEYYLTGAKQEKLLEISSIIENAPYMLARAYDSKIAGNSTGASSSNSHSSNSSSSSASTVTYIGSSTGASSSNSHSSNSSSSSASRATVPLENRL